MSEREHTGGLSLRFQNSNFPFIPVNSYNKVARDVFACLRSDFSSHSHNLWETSSVFYLQWKDVLRRMTTSATDNDWISDWSTPFQLVQKAEYMPQHVSLVCMQTTTTQVLQMGRPQETLYRLYDPGSPFKYILMMFFQTTANSALNIA